QWRLDVTLETSAIAFFERCHHECIIIRRVLPRKPQPHRSAWKRRVRTRAPCRLSRLYRTSLRFISIVILCGMAFKPVTTAMKARTFSNVWDALEDNPEEAANLTMRSDVMIAIKDAVQGWKTTQARAAQRLGITQPRLNDLL